MTEFSIFRIETWLDDDGMFVRASNDLRTTFSLASKAVGSFATALLISGVASAAVPVENAPVIAKAAVRQGLTAFDEQLVPLGYWDRLGGAIAGAKLPTQDVSYDPPVLI